MEAVAVQSSSMLIPKVGFIIPHFSSSMDGSGVGRPPSEETKEPEESVATAEPRRLSRHLDDIIIAGEFRGDIADAALKIEYSEQKSTRYSSNQVLDYISIVPQQTGSFRSKHQQANPYLQSAVQSSIFAHSHALSDKYQRDSVVGSGYETSSAPETSYELYSLSAVHQGEVYFAESSYSSLLIEPRENPLESIYASFDTATPPQTPYPRDFFFEVSVSQQEYIKPVVKEIYQERNQTESYLPQQNSFSEFEDAQRERPIVITNEQSMVTKERPLVRESYREPSLQVRGERMYIHETETLLFIREGHKEVQRETSIPAIFTENYHAPILFANNHPSVQASNKETQWYKNEDVQLQSTYIPQSIDFVVPQSIPFIKERETMTLPFPLLASEREISTEPMESQYIEQAINSPNIIKHRTPFIREQKQESLEEYIANSTEPLDASHHSIIPFSPVGEELQDVASRIGEYQSPPQTTQNIETKVKEHHYEKIEEKTASPCEVKTGKYLEKAREFAKNRKPYAAKENEGDKKYEFKQVTIDGVVQEGIKGFYEFTVSDASDEKMPVPVYNDQTGESREEKRSKNTVNTQVYQNGEGIAVTVKQKLINIDTGEKIQNEYIERIIGFDTSKLKEGGIIFTVNGKEIGEGTVPMHDYSVKNGDVIGVYHIENGFRYKKGAILKQAEK